LREEVKVGRDMALRQRKKVVSSGTGAVRARKQEGGRLQPWVWPLPLLPRKGETIRLFPDVTVWDVGMMGVLLVICLATRLYRIMEPRGVVFDEYHFGEFVNGYFSHRYFFDIHPPLGKLVLALGGLLGGYDPNGFKYETIGKPFPRDLNYGSLRLTAAILGSMVIPVLYLTARNFRLSIEAATTAACFLLLDMSFCIESRLILTDSQLLLSCAIALLCMTELWKTEDGTPERTIWIILTGLGCGTAISVKWTGLATPALTGLISLTGIYFTRHQKRIPFYQCVLIGSIGLMFYLATWWFHFRLLYLSGPGDAFMNIKFQRTLIGNRFYNSKFPKESFLTRTYLLNKEMLRANAAITARHPWESKWYTWPISWRGILYYVSGRREVYLVGNIVVYILVLGAVILYIPTVGLAIWNTMGRKEVTSLVTERQKPTEDVLSVSESEILPREMTLGRAGALGTLFFCGWGINLLPYIGINRCAFLYHYLPGLYYGLLLFATMLDTLIRWKHARRFIAVALIGAAATVFYLFAPLVYAYPARSRESLRWFPKWN